MSTIRKAWGMNTELKIVEVGSNLFQFKFQTDFDLNRVLKGDRGVLITNCFYSSDGIKG